MATLAVQHMFLSSSSALGLQSCTTVLGFWYEFGHLNSGSHTSLQSTYLAESPPQPLPGSFLGWNCPYTFLLIYTDAPLQMYAYTGIHEKHTNARSPGIYTYLQVYIVYKCEWFIVYSSTMCTHLLCTHPASILKP